MGKAQEFRKVFEDEQAELLDEMMVYEDHIFNDDADPLYGEREAMRFRTEQAWREGRKSNAQ